MDPWNQNTGLFHILSWSNPVPLCYPSLRDKLKGSLLLQILASHSDSLHSNYRGFSELILNIFVYHVDAKLCTNTLSSHLIKLTP